jgi:hypothetical protein
MGEYESAVWEIPELWRKYGLRSPSLQGLDQPSCIEHWKVCLFLEANPQIALRYQKLNEGEIYNRSRLHYVDVLRMAEQAETEQTLEHAHFMNRRGFTPKRNLKYIKMTHERFKSAAMWGYECKLPKIWMNYAPL